MDKQRASDDLAAVQAVGGVTGEQEYGDVGNELGQADVGETHGIVCRGIDVPADRYVQHLGAEFIADTDCSETAKGRVVTEEVKKGGIAGY